MADKIFQFFLKVALIGVGILIAMMPIMLIIGFLRMLLHV